MRDCTILLHKRKVMGELHEMRSADDSCGGFNLHDGEGVTCLGNV